jgi:uncharacterized RDD family membrane protein YckC
MLIECPECGRSVSSHAPACPQCGYPLGDIAVAPPAPPAPSPPALPSSRALQPPPPEPEWRGEPVASSHHGAGREPSTKSSLSPPPSQWREAPPAPWSRLAARMLDMLLFSVTIWVVVGAVFASGGLPKPLQQVSDSSMYSGLLMLPILMPFMALCIGATGSTPGKWAFGIRVVNGDGYPAGFGRALHREIGVWVYGLGLGIPIVTLVTQVIAYQTLKRTGSSSWDAETHTSVRYLNHTLLTRLRAAAAVLGLVAGMVMLMAAGA